MAQQIKTEKTTIQLWSVIDHALTRKLDSLYIKRDPYLNALLTTEIEQLNLEMDFRNSDAVATRLSERKLPDRVKRTIELDDTLITRINDVLKDKNISRDAFINRVLFFLIVPSSYLDLLGIEYQNRHETIVNPLDGVRSILADPFYPIRAKNKSCFYTLACFPDAPFIENGHNLFCLNIAINEKEWARLNGTTESLYKDLSAFKRQELTDQSSRNIPLKDCTSLTQLFFESSELIRKSKLLDSSKLK